MTVAEILEQAKTLSLPERRELTKLLIDTLDPTTEQAQTNWKTGAEIVAMMQEIGVIEFVDEDIDDPVEWVQTQRQKRTDQLSQFEDNQS